jgi:hypothetical protein
MSAMCSAIFAWFGVAMIAAASIRRINRVWPSSCSTRATKYEYATSRVSSPAFDEFCSTAASGVVCEPASAAYRSAAVLVSKLRTPLTPTKGRSPEQQPGALLVSADFF